MPGCAEALDPCFCFPLGPQVEYLSDGFLEKNRDTVYEEQINILKASKVKGTRGGDLGQDHPQQDVAGPGWLVVAWGWEGRQGEGEGACQSCMSRVHSFLNWSVRLKRQWSSSSPPTCRL